MGKPAAILLSLLIIFSLGVLKVSAAVSQPDTQCTSRHQPISKAPTSLKSAMDYFEDANYSYEIGNCTKAILEYTRSIKLDPTYAPSYNNRAYTYMRIQDYNEALPDLNKAIELRPNYIQARMNRGDLYNYYGPVLNQKKALEDYDVVIGAGTVNDTSVCGHKAMAQVNKILPLALLRFILNHPEC